MKKKSASQRGPKRSCKNALLLTLAVLALCAAPTIAVAADCLAETFWTDATGSWFVATNWLNITANYGMTVDGTLHPSGTLSITGNAAGNLTLHSSAAMLCNVVPTGADNVDIVSAGALLNGRLAVTMTGAFTPGARYTLLHAASGRINDSRFSSVSINFPPGQGFSPQINYDATHVYLDLVPNTGP